MVVQHNLTAMNSNRMLGITTGQQAKSSEKLSSGYRINRAADDAAGLTISEKMRKQMRGLDRASTNAQDGVSAVQTAEGALTEVHDMLQRMNELAVQAANGTNSESDRDAIQDEIDQLTTEIDRVAETTKFNEIYMLKGDEGTKPINMKAHDAGLKGKLVDNGDGTATFTMDELKEGDTVSIGGKVYNIVGDGKQTSADATKDYTYTPAKGATASFSINGWTNNNQSAVKIGNMAAAIDGATAADADALVAKLNADTGFNADYVASLSEDKKTLIITANDQTKTAQDVADAIDNTSTKVANAAVADANITSEEATEASFKRTEGTKLYAENGTKELTDEEALERLGKSETLYTTKGVEVKQTLAEVNYTEAKGATASFSINGWTNNNQSAVKIGNMAAAIDGAAAADVDALVAKLNADTGFNADYVASLSEDKKTLIITANDQTKTAQDVADAIDNTNTKVANAAVADANITSEEATKAAVDAGGKALYAAGGTEALSEAEILEAKKNGEDLYSTAATRGDNDITVKEAYEKAKAALLQANQIGDINNTADVTYGAAKAPVEKKAEDYKVGEKVKVGDQEYTVATSAEDMEKLLDAIETAEKAGTNTATIKISFKTDAGDQEYTITPSNTAGTASTIQQTKKDGAAATDTKTYADIKTALKDNAGVEVTIDTTNAAVTGAADVDLTPFTVADDKTFVSAAKAAELENAAPAGDGEPSNVFNITTGSADVAKTLSFNLHVGADADMTNKIQVDIDTMNSAFLGIKDIDVVGQGNDGGMAATYAIDAIADAIAKVSSQRSALGAIQNRLEHTIANVDNVVENTTAAESRIRDTDMAEEMVEYSKNNILAQAGQSMLAQANQSNQGVLSLLG